VPRGELAIAWDLAAAINVGSWRANYARITYPAARTRNLQVHRKHAVGHRAGHRHILLLPDDLGESGMAERARLSRLYPGAVRPREHVDHDRVDRGHMESDDRL